MNHTSMNLGPTNAHNPLNHHPQTQVVIPISLPPVPQLPPPPRKLPSGELVVGSRENYMKIGVKLYEASIKGNWELAKGILDDRPELVRFAITENYETPLHIAASAESTKSLERFVKELVKRMEKEDLELQNENYNTALCLAAAAGNVEIAKIMVSMNKAVLNIPADKGIMPLYMAALFAKPEMVKYLYEQSNKMSGDFWTSDNRSWVLQKCVETDMFDIALIIAKDRPELTDKKRLLTDVLVALAQKIDAFEGIKPHILLRIIKSNKMSNLSKLEFNALDILGNNYLPWTLDANIHLTAKSMGTTIEDGNEASTQDKAKTMIFLCHHLHEDLKREYLTVEDPLELWKNINEHFDHQKTVLLPMARYKWMHLRLQDFKTVIFAVFHVKLRHAEKDSEALLLLKSIWKKIAIMPKSEIDDIIRGPPSKQGSTITGYPSRVLFLAAKMGNTKFIIELIQSYPDLIWKQDDKGRTIFHIAVKRRQEKIYNLLYEIGAMKDLITPIKDKKGNNMLHLVGKSAKPKRFQNVSGVALQMQRELLWFKEVEQMIPPKYRQEKNGDGKIPHDLFTAKHADLVSKGEDWMKNTASQCMVAATLIATIVFAAAFTLPGGYNQNTGIPFFRHKPSLIVFVISDAVSLIFSSASVLMFLSILTSRYAERDFLESLPKKLMFGLATLFLSIVTMMVAFSASFFVLYHNNLKWVPIIVTGLASAPVLLFAILHFRLLGDVFYSTYRSRYLFKPEKRMLYY